MKNTESLAAKIWKVPYENIPSKPTYHAQKCLEL